MDFVNLVHFSLSAYLAELMLGVQSCVFWDYQHKILITKKIGPKKSKPKFFLKVWKKKLGKFSDFQKISKISPKNPKISENFRIFWGNF